LHRSTEIRNRSPKHMDDRIGPVVVGVALIIALVANFVFKVASLGPSAHDSTLFGCRDKIRLRDLYQDLPEDAKEVTS
jgi:hypothetical protein